MHAAPHVAPSSRKPCGENCVAILLQLAEWNLLPHFGASRRCPAGPVCCCVLYLLRRLDYFAKTAPPRRWLSRRQNDLQYPAESSLSADLALQMPGRLIARTPGLGHADCRACYLSRHRDHFAKTAPYHFLDYLSHGPPLVGEGLKTASEVRPARPRRVGVADATAPDVQRVLTEDYYCCTSPF